LTTFKRKGLATYKLYTRKHPFFEFVLPYLKPRTTDVHTAVCLSYWSNYTKKLEKERGTKINKKIVAYGLILHDSGWNALTKKEIADSFAVKGLKIKGEAIGPKRRHAYEGVKIARKILNEYKFKPALTEEGKEEESIRLPWSLGTLGSAGTRNRCYWSFWSVWVVCTFCSFWS